MAGFALTLWGGFELRDGAGTLVRLPTRKSEALLAYLVMEAPLAPTRESIAALLWGESSEQGALASLRQAMSLITKCCGQPLIAPQGRGLALVPGSIQADVLSFAQLSRSTDLEDLSRAAALHRGTLMAGMAVNESPFEDWLRAARERARNQVVRLLEQLAVAQQQAGALSQALEAGLQWLDIDPLSEAGHRMVMELYAAQGHRSAALRQYQVCVNVLQRELDTEPDLSTRRLYNTLLRQSDAEAQRTVSQDAPHEPPGATPSTRRPAALLQSPVHDSPLVGREAELACLLGSLAQTESPEGRVVALLGEAGIGKTRLCEELTVRAAAQGRRVLVGHGYDSQQLFPLAPWVDMLRSAGLPSEHALLADLHPPWRAELIGLLPELGPGPARTEDDANTPARQAHLFEAVVQLLLLLSTRSPLLLVLEDLHWADESSLRLLATTARRAQGWPVLIVGTARAEAVEGGAALRRTLRELAQGPAFERLDLLPLTRDQTTSLVESLLRAGADEAATRTLADRVWRTSEGNPFVVVEAVRTGGVARTSLNESDLSLPERVRELIKGHIELLGPLARQLLALAAVAGRELEFRLLQESARRPAQDVAEALEELVRRRVFRLVGEAFDFTHARIRQAVSDDLLAPNRRALHLTLAQAFEALHAGELAAVGDRLAYHYAHTHEHGKAVTYLTALAHRSAHDGAHDQAVMALDQALDHVARAGARVGAVQRRELHLRKARSLFFLGRFAEVLALLLPEQADVDAAADPRLAAAYYLRLGSTRTYLGEHAQAVDDANRALLEAERCGDSATMGKAHFLLALESFWARPSEGVAHGEKAVALLQPTPEQWWLGQAYWILGLNLSYRGRFAQALSFEAQCRSLAEATNDRRLASYAAWTTGFIQTLAGRLPEAVSACRLSVSLALDPLNRMTALGMLGLALVEGGHGTEAMVVLDEAIPQALQFRIPQMHGLFLSFRGEAWLQQGDLAQAREQALAGAEITAQAGYVYGLGWAQRVLGRIARAANDAVGARSWFDRSIATFDGMGAPFEGARTQVELAGLLASTGHRDEATAQARVGLATLSSLGLDSHAAHAAALLKAAAA
jgi:DNA-binding SARP family transcriptional activator/tetratricopeptide (TPR) repeat protein